MVGGSIPSGGATPLLFSQEQKSFALRHKETLGRIYIPQLFVELIWFGLPLIMGRSQGSIPGRGQFVRPRSSVVERLNPRPPNLFDVFFCDELKLQGYRPRHPWSNKCLFVTVLFAVS